MDPRTQKILEAAILEFIETGIPVSSGELYRRHQFTVKPATIRNELAALDEGGFLTQPHTSAGRVPTNKGYEFLVEHIVAALHEDVRIRLSRDLSALIDELSRFAFPDAVQNLADELSLLSVGYDIKEGTVWKSGLHDLIDDLVTFKEVETMSEIQEIVRDFENIDGQMKELSHVVEKRDAPTVFIGQSPITKSPHLSVIADQFKLDGDTFLLAAVGPRRMDYGANIRFFTGMKRKLQSLNN